MTGNWSVLDHDDLTWIAKIVEIVAAAEGAPWRVALERIDAHVLAADPAAFPPTRVSAVVGAVMWLIGGRARAAPLARRVRGLVLGHPAVTAPARAARIAAAAQVLELPDVEVEAALWSDLPLERRVAVPASFAGGLEIAATANVQIIQRALRRARAIHLRVWGDPGTIIRAAAFRGLLATASQGAAGDTVLDIAGPLSLFHRTAVYGRALGGLIPLLAECGRFELVLDTETAGQAYQLTLASPVLLPLAPAHLGAVANVAIRLARELGQAGWNVTLAPAPVAAGGSLACPDLVVERDGICWSIETVGFWTAEYLARKAVTYERAGISDVILCIDESRGCADDAPPASAHIVRFTRRIDAAEVLAIVSRRSSRSPAGSAQPASRAPSD